MADVEAPPQFPGAPKKSKTGCILGGIALGVVLCCCGGGGALLYFGKGVIGKTFGLVGCSMAMDQQRNALLGYAAKNGGKFPPAKTWQDDIRPYVTVVKGQQEAGQPFEIPGPDADHCDAGANTSIAFNADLAGKKLEAIKEPYETIALFEIGGRGRNKTQSYKEQPFETSPVLLKGARRGWIREAIKGQPTYKDQFGKTKQAPIAGGSASIEMGD